MGDGYDRLDDINSGNGMGGFAIGVLTGAVIGAGVALLFAPKPGSELRNQISDQASNMADQASNMAKTAKNTAQDGYRRATDTANEWANRGKDAVNKARDM